VTTVMNCLIPNQVISRTSELRVRHKGEYPPPPHTVIDCIWPFICTVTTHMRLYQLQNMRTKHLKQHSLLSVLIIKGWFIKQLRSVMLG
jgi:hypothetical protein